MFYLIFITLLLTACSVQAPTEGNSCREDLTAYEVTIHSFHVGGTDVCFIFDKDKPLLIDCSTNRDSVLIERYLFAQKKSHIDYVICAAPPIAGAYPISSVGTVFSAAENCSNDKIQPVRAGACFSLNTSSIHFTESSAGPMAVLTYKEGIFRYPLCVQAESDATVETSVVTITRPSPDGVHTQMSAKPLRNLL